MANTKECPCCDARMSDHRACYWNGKRICDRCYDELDALANNTFEPAFPSVASIIAVVVLSLIAWSVQ